MSYDQLRARERSNRSPVLPCSRKQSRKQVETGFQGLGAADDGPTIAAYNPATLIDKGDCFTKTNLLRMIVGDHFSGLHFTYLDAIIEKAGQIAKAETCRRVVNHGECGVIPQLVDASYFCVPPRPA